MSNLLFRKKTTYYYLGFWLFNFYLLTLPIFGRLNIFNLFGKISISDLLLIFSLVLLLVVYKFIEMKRSFIFFMVAYSSIIIFSLISLFINDESNFYVILHTLRFSKIIILLLLVGSFSKNKKSRKILVYSFIIGAIISAMVGILQMINLESIWNITDRFYVQSLDSALTSYAYRNRIASTSFFPINGNYFGSYMAISIIITWYYRYIFKVWQTIAILLVCLLALFSSLSWTSIIGLFLAVMISIIVSAIKNKHFDNNSSIILILGVFAGIIFLMVNFNKFYNKFFRYFLREENIFNSPGLIGRITLWKDYFSKFNNPRAMLLGMGYQNIDVVDNFYLEILLSGGLIPLLFYLFVLIYCFREAKNVEQLSALILIITLNLTASYGGYESLMSGFILIFAKNNLSKNEKCNISDKRDISLSSSSI